MKKKHLYSVVMPARDEAENLPETMDGLHRELTKADISYEIVLVNDHSLDKTSEVVAGLASHGVCIKEYHNSNPPGFGNAIRCGIEKVAGDIVVIVMADGSDDPEDVVKFYRKITEGGVDCCFGTRWSAGGKAIGYPFHKLLINRFANFLIMLVFGIRYNDATNAFKAYRREVLQGCRPLLSHHFNLTVEIPIKAIIRGYSYAVLPNKWYRRKHGETRLKLKEMGSRYLFIILYCLLEKWLSRGDYHRSKKDRS